MTSLGFLDLIPPRVFGLVELFWRVRVRISLKSSAHFLECYLRPS